MTQAPQIGCACGWTRPELRGDSILASECLCDRCRAAAARLAALASAPNILTPWCTAHEHDPVPSHMDGRFRAAADLEP
jgi:hypothetical protein